MDKLGKIAISGIMALPFFEREAALGALFQPRSRGKGRGGLHPQKCRKYQSKYTPHQGAQEKARRVRQMARHAAT